MLKVTVHGHRPSWLSPPAPASTSNDVSPSPAVPTGPQASASGSASANPPGQTTKDINLVFFKLRVHRQTARQASLLAQLPNQAPAAAMVDDARQADALSAIPNRAAGLDRPPSPLTLPMAEWADDTEGTSDPVVDRPPSPLTLPELEPTGGTEEGVSDQVIDQPPSPLTEPLAGLTPTPQSDEEYLAHWTAWVQEGGTTGGNRAEALNMMSAWRLQDRPDQRLQLQGLDLTSLPDHLPPGVRHIHAPDNQLRRLPDHLPDSLERLDVGHNQLKELPSELPASLNHLDASDNLLTRLPRLPALLESVNVRNNRLRTLPEDLPDGLLTLNVRNNKLRDLPPLPIAMDELYLNGNQLRSLPAALPPSLLFLDASENELVSLPDKLPTGLVRLSLGSNHLSSLPEYITSQLGSGCRVHLNNNPLRESVRLHLNELVNAEGYQGPRITFSMAAPPAAAPRPLPDAVADWYEPIDQDAVRSTWETLSTEDGAVPFSQFLDRLRRTVNAGNPKFNQSTAEWLTHLAANPPLRSETLQICLGATTTCEDRVTLTFNDMQRARLVGDVERGHYDQRLPDLISLARGMFRLDQLDGAARAKVETLHFVDEVEVYLAYQVQLRERLQLPVDAPDMRFFDVSYVTQQDLDQAEHDVRAAERQGFADYLSTDWQPWQSVLNRLDPERYAAARSRLLAAMETTFEGRLNARLEDVNLENDIDAQRTLGPQVRSEIAHEIMDPLTKSFLANRNLSHLLTPSVAPTPTAEA